MLYIIQVMAKKKMAHQANNEHIYTDEHLKIHPVEAEHAMLAHKKLENFYKN